MFMGSSEPGSVSNDTISHLDWLPTIMAAVGKPDIKTKLKQGHKVGDKNFKVHLDGYNFLPHWKGETDKNPRREFFYFSDTGDLLNLRVDQWKIVFAEQRSEGFDVWQDPFTFLRLSKLFNLRSDPFELADHISINYGRWRIDRVFALVPARGFVARFLSTFREFPPRQRPASFTIDQVMESMKAGVGSGRQ